MPFFDYEQVRAMSPGEFEEWRTTQKRWLLVMDTSEALLMLIVFIWGFQLVLVSFLGKPITEPISMALMSFLPKVPLVFHGLLLMIVSVLHSVFIATDKVSCRRRTILFECGFFLYVWFAVLLAHLLIPGAFIIPLYIGASVLNYWSLFKIDR